MKGAAVFVLMMFSCLALGRQTNSTPPGDVRIKLSAGSPQYCQGPTALSGVSSISKVAEGPNDIRLRLPLKLWYENRRLEPIIVPPQRGILTRMTVAGQNGVTTLRNTGNSGSLEYWLDSPTPPSSTFTLYGFSLLDGTKAASLTVPDLVQCLSASDRNCVADLVTIPILDRSSGLDLRGRTIEIVTTRDHSLEPEWVRQFSEKWKQYGTVWTGSLDSESVRFRIPDDPSPLNCTTAVSK